MAKTVTALIVDDDRAMQRLLADALTHEGFSVCVEKDGEWALKTFAKRSIQVVILDILLPAVNGYEVARKMRQLPKGQNVPLIFISGVYRAPGQRKDAIEKYRAVEFLEKPFKLPALREALKKALGDSYPDAKAAQAERDRIEKSDPGIYADRSAAEEAKAVEEESRQKPANELSALRGNLSSKSFPELLSEIYRWRADGALLLRHDKVKKIIYFRQGIPYSVKSNLLSECLGKILVKEKMISEAECEESLKRMKSSKRQQGTVLIEMGCISPPNLQYALNLQLQAKLFDIFSWQDGDFQFNTKAELPPEATGLEMTTSAIIYEGLKRHWELDAIHMAMEPFQGKFVHPAPDPLYRFQDAGLDEEEVALLGACDGRKTVKTLAALAILPPIETMRLLLAMKFSQMVEFRDEASAAPERAIPAPSKSHVPWDTEQESVRNTALNDTDDDEQTPPPAPPAEPPPDVFANATRRGLGDDDDAGEATVVDRKAYVPGQDAEAEEPPLQGEPISKVEKVDHGALPPEFEPADPKERRAAKPPPPVDEPPAKPTKSAGKGRRERSTHAAHVEEVTGSRLRHPKSKRRRTVDEVSAPPPPPPSARPPSGRNVVVARPPSKPGRAVPPPPPPVAGPPPLPKRPVSTEGPPPIPVGLHRPVTARAAGSLLPELSAVISLHISAEERALRERLAAATVALKKKDYFQMLGVAPNASADAIKQAYFVLAKEYHPDRVYRSASAEVRNLANEIYQLLSTAYETLKDPEERERYVSDLAKGIKKDVSDEVSKILAAEGKFQRGEELLRKRQYSAAHDAFQEAVGLYDQEGEFHAFLGWTLFQTDPRNPDVARRAMDDIERAIRLNPKVDKSYLFLGYIHKATGRPDKAEQQFERAIQCNPDCTEALRELRLLGKSKR
ncbi:MAG: response regulator [Deltaproteobacteria bacterium]|nr:response regulator [Deltaproteobacteria bacterium]